MYTYICELCSTEYDSDKEQKNQVCPTCCTDYNISEDYIYGSPNKEEPVSQPIVPEIKNTLQESELEDQVRNYYIYGNNYNPNFVENASNSNVDTTRKSANQNLSKEQLLFSITKIIKLGLFSYLLVDEPNRKWCCSITKQVTYGTIIYDFKDIAAYDLYQDSDIITKSGGVGRAIVGGLLAGSAGAIVGATTSRRKNNTIVKNMYIRISFKDISKKYVKIPICHNVSIDSFLYNDARQKADEIISLLEAMTSQTNDTPFSTNISIADELRKYKELLDLGAISQEEYNATKKKLLEQI